MVIMQCFVGLVWWVMLEVYVGNMFVGLWQVCFGVWVLLVVKLVVFNCFVVCFQVDCLCSVGGWFEMFILLVVVGVSGDMYVKQVVWWGGMILQGFDWG